MTRKIIAVQFIGTPFKSYNFLTDMEDLKKGEKVVVDTVNGLAIAEVEKYVEYPTGKVPASKWIVQKIDTTSHEKRLENERLMNGLKLKMESRRKQLEEIQIYQLLAKEDPEMKAILEEYNSLSK
ncbi:hypothetical protein [Bacillus wiedmannii]|uniref:hypothetical protein n=1 Tax=Bacillus wiedmannii TaxID=1890302 RepID=UPI000BFB45F4|nr:hypothetical protein [Bacillus wiedmannii]PHE70544.1 hypothetical protein COF77_25360 [Bacillus wiedmannii]